MTNFTDVKLSNDIKAYEQAHEPPFLGDVRPTKDYPAGTNWGTITEFEVWNGERWVGSEEWNTPTMIQSQE